MKKIILCLFYSLLFCQLMQAQKTKQLRYVPPLSTDSSFTKGSYECEVLQLTNQNRSTGIMIVLVEKGEEKMHRSQLRSNYLFKRERMYLRTVFFAEVEVLERIHVVTGKCFAATFEKRLLPAAIMECASFRCFFQYCSSAFGKSLRFTSLMYCCTAPVICS